MSETSQTKRRKLMGWALLAAWVIAFAGAFLAFVLTPSKDFGLAAGWNRVGVFIQWQAVAGLLALLAAGASRAYPARSALRRLLLVPIAMLLALVLFIAGVVVWANMQRPDPASPLPPTKPPTAAAPVAEPVPAQ